MAGECVWSSTSWRLDVERPSRRSLGGEERVRHERYRYLYTREQTSARAREVRLLCDELGTRTVQVAYDNNHANYATTNAAEFGDELSSPREGAVQRLPAQIAPVV